MIDVVTSLGALGHATEAVEQGVGPLDDAAVAAGFLAAPDAFAGDARLEPDPASALASWALSAGRVAGRLDRLAIGFARPRRRWVIGYARVHVPRRNAIRLVMVQADIDHR